MSAALQRQAGLTLVEMLVALLVVSVGMLGIAALQLSSLRANQESYGRTQASVMAADILDRMRANQAGVFNGDYSAIPKDGLGNAGTLARDDLVAWQGTINRLLGADAGGSIDVVGNVATVTITWHERAQKELTGQAAQGGADVSFVTRSEI